MREHTASQENFLSGVTGDEKNVEVQYKHYSTPFEAPEEVTSTIHGAKSSMVGVDFWLFRGQELFELRLVQNFDAEGFGLVEFGAGVGTDDNIGGFLADR